LSEEDDAVLFVLISARDFISSFNPLISFSYFSIFLDFSSFSFFKVLYSSSNCLLPDEDFVSDFSCF